MMQELIADTMPGFGQDRPKDGLGFADDRCQQFMTFTLGDEEFGIDIMMVREIKGWSETTTIPNSPVYVLGVINLRGVVVPIFDLRVRFGRAATEASAMHAIIIVSTDAKTVGLLVDRVSDIVPVPKEAIRAVPEVASPIDDNFLEGLVTSGDRMITLISLPRLLSSRPHAAA